MWVVAVPLGSRGGGERFTHMKLEAVGWVEERGNGVSGCGKCSRVKHAVCVFNPGKWRIW